MGIAREHRELWSYRLWLLGAERGSKPGRIEEANVIAVCDRSPAAQKRANKLYPNIEVTSDPAELMSSTKIDAVAIVTPVWTHYELAKAALENGKHVFVEKPFTSNVAQAEELIELADRQNLKIMVDHTFLFTGAVRKIKQLLDDDALESCFIMTQPALIWAFFNMT